MKRKKLFKITSIVAALALVVGASFAYFTDYATTSTSGTSGTVAVSLDSDINLLDADGQDIINPGDQRDASFAVTNEGNKSIDVRTTVALTALDHEGNAINFTGDAATQSEYDLYLASDVELVEGKGYAPKAGAQPIQVKSIDGNVITYVLPEYSLNGNSDKYDEVETIDGVDAFTKDNEFVFVMKGAAGNEWQASSVMIDVLVEAKQHENTNAGWDIVAQETVTSGSINQSAVLAESILTVADKTSIPVSAVDSEGNDLNAYAYDITGDTKDTLLASLEASNLANSADVDALIEVESDDFDNLADTTFDVSTIAKEGDQVVILHYDEEKQEWEYITTDTVDADGTVSGDFSSYSPVAFVVISGSEGNEGTESEAVSGYLVGCQIIGETDDPDWLASSAIYATMVNDGLNIAQLKGPGAGDAARKAQLGSAAHGWMTTTDIEVATANEYGCIDNTTTYSWTSYEVVSQDDATITVKLISDEADFSNVKLENMSCGCSEFDFSGITIEGANLTWTVTLNK